VFYQINIYCMLCFTALGRNLSFYNNGYGIREYRGQYSLLESTRR